MATVFAEANEAFVSGDYDAALDLYSKAITADPNNSKYYAARAEAHIKVEDYEEALSDANKALQLDPENVLAHFRKGVALFNEDEFESARAAFQAGAALGKPGRLDFATWIRKCDAELQDEAATSGGTARHAAATAQRSTPATAPAAAPPTPAATATAQRSTAAAATKPAESKDIDMHAPVAPSLQVEAPTKYRHQHFQTQDKVTVQVFAKKMSRERASVSITADKLLVEIKDAPDGQVEYTLDVDLYAQVVPEESKYDFLSTQIEIRLKKRDTSIAWPTLEKSNRIAAPNYSTPDAAPASYPSSAPKRHNWDMLEKEVKEEEKNEKLEGDAALQKLFRDIYSGADEDTRRAMMKSFVESNGTVLSTNWKEVGEKPVECTPPDGMELKKY